jgi:nucleotide-binding universal stress UspA family protein
MKILVGFDGSEMNQRAISVAQKRAKSLNAQLHVFTSAASANGEKTKNSRLKTGLKDAEMMCRACGIDCKIIMSEQKQTPAESILDYAAQNDIDEIVVGLRKKSQLGKLLFGSTARQVVLEAPCPVLIVK